MPTGKKIPMRLAKQVAVQIVKAIMQNSDMVYQICGSIRRKSKADVERISFIVNDLPKVWDVIHNLCRWHGVPFPVSKSSNRFITIKRLFPIPVVFHHAYDEEWGAMALALTGNFLVNIQMRAEAKRQGMKLNQYGLWHNENIIAGRTEEQIFEALGLVYLKPEEREFTQQDKLKEA